MLNLKSKITVANNHLSIADFLKATLDASRKRSLQKMVNAYTIYTPCMEVKMKIPVLKRKRKNVTAEKDD